QSCQSRDLSLLSPDSSYVCYPSADGGDPCCCRRSPRLLTNGYYSVTDDSFSWDDDGNVSLTPCKTSVSYKENLVRIFRRRRRPRGSLAHLLSDVTESCQSWLDDKVFRGVFRLRSSELDDGFTYDHIEILPPPDKVTLPPKLVIQEEICSEIYQSKEEGFTQLEGGLFEVPPPSPVYASSCCCQTSPERAGEPPLPLCLGFVNFWFFQVNFTFVFSGPMGEWRRAKTEVSPTWQ
uniref:Uncharacterized protein n=1 Tax=Mola mola TaxID=94237 RepID=A0A3Q3WCB7_MOLML